MQAKKHFKEILNSEETEDEYFSSNSILKIQDRFYSEGI